MLLGTVAIEPNRWGTIHADRSPETVLSAWLSTIDELGVDGLEVWDGHVADPAERAAVAGGPVPVVVLNSYVGFDDPDATARIGVAAVAGELDVTGIKFNVGNDPEAEAAYRDRLAEWIEALPADVAAICECHQGISIAEAPDVAARILAGAGPADRVQALIHTHDDAGLLAAKFDAYGERIRHVHVNHLDFTTMTHPTLTEVEDRLGATVTQLRSLGFRGSWTLEFVHGLLTDGDEAGALLDQAADDVAVLRRVLATG